MVDQIKKHLCRMKLPFRIILLLSYLLLIGTIVYLVQRDTATKESKKVCKPAIKVEVVQVNPLPELLSTGKRVQSLPRNAIVGAVNGKIQFHGNNCSIQDDETQIDNILAFDYRTCRLDNVNCVITHPLPESVFPPTITFCLHEGDDTISNTIRGGGVWDIERCFFVWSILVQDSELQLIDIGANIGASLMIAAKMGRDVIAVEPMNVSLNILCKTVIANNLTDRVTIVPFAVSDERKAFKPMTYVGNWGGTYLEDLNATDTNPNVVKSILTDDMLKFIQFRKAVLKIDIEGHENRALKGAVKLFEKVYIPVIVMEWQGVQNALNEGKPEGADFVIDFLTGRGYTAYRNQGEKLDRSAYRNWGRDIYWLHQNYTLKINPWSVY